MGLLPACAEHIQGRGQTASIQRAWTSNSTHHGIRDVNAAGECVGNRHSPPWPIPCSARQGRSGIGERLHHTYPESWIRDLNAAGDVWEIAIRRRGPSRAPHARAGAASANAHTYP